MADLDELWLRRIVRELGFGYDFSHDRIREVVTEAIPPARRRQLHRAVADGLVELAGGQIGAVSSRLAVHYEEAGLVAAAVEAHQRAADHALQLYSLGDAMMSLRSALALLEHLAARRWPRPNRARSANHIGRGDGGERRLRLPIGRTAVPAGGGPLSKAGIAGQLTGPPWIGSQRGGDLQVPAAPTPLPRSCCRGNDEPIAVTEGHYLLGVSAFWQGDLTGARRSLQDAIDSYRPELGPEHLARYAQDPKAICLVRLAATEWWFGELGKARELAEEARRFADSLDHPNTLGYVLNWIGLLAVEADDRDRLSDLVDDLKTLLSGHQLWYPETGRILYQGWLDVMDGNRAVSTACGRRSPDGSPTRGYRTCRTTSACWLVAVCSPGNLEVARAAVAQAKLRSAEHGEDFMEPELWRLDGEIAARDGDIEQARCQLRPGVDVARRQGAVWLELKLVESIERLGDRPGKP